MPSRFLFLAIFISSAFQGCVKEEDFDFSDLSLTAWNPEVALPLVNASLGYSDVSGLSEVDQLGVDPTGRIVIVRKSTIFERTGKSLFTIPDQQAVLDITIDALQANAFNSNGTLSDTVPMDFLFVLPSGQRLDKASLTTGSIDFQISNQLPIEAEYGVWIPSLQKVGAPFIAAFQVPASSVRSFTVDLAGYDLDIASSSPPNRLSIYFIMNLSGPGATISPGDEVDITTSVNGLDYSYLEGDLGIQDLLVPLDTVPLDIYGSDNGDNYFLSDPRLNLEVENSVGVPAQLSNCLVQPIRVDGSPINNSLLPFTAYYPISYPLVPGGSESTVISINSQNSQIVSSYAARPASVVYRAEVGLNRPQSSSVNFITDSSRIRVNLESELPLSGYVEQLTILDSSEFNLSTMQEVDSLVFRIETRNGMPVSGRLQVFFLQAGVVTDSLFHSDDFYLIEATQVDANGFAIGANINVHDEPISSDRLEGFYEADQVVFKAVMNTVSPPTQVAIRQGDHLDIKLGIRVRLTLNN